MGELQSSELIEPLPESMRRDLLMTNFKSLLQITMIAAALCLNAAPAFSQAVCLPAPRLLTTTPMGGQVGSTVEVTITGDNLEDLDELRFSHPAITAVPKVDASGAPVANTFLVTIAADCPAGLHEARVMSRLGISSSRVFHVGQWPEVLRNKANTSVETAWALPLNTVCNATMTRQAVDHYAFEAKAGQRIVIDCAAKGIDSKLQAVLIVADAQGNDLMVERRGGVIDFTPEQDGTYMVKIHDLTFNGGPECFYRLCLQTAAPDERVPRLPSTESVSSFSWPPIGLPAEAALAEAAPDDPAGDPQQITLPCDLSGRFFPAADVDRFEFTASKGEVWWIEVASERLGRPTDPSIIVQRVQKTDDGETLTDVAELSDIPSPVKVSSNGYAYDGPPYNAGSADINGKLEIKEDGVYRVQLTDLFGGTRTDPGNVYRLIIRRAQPDFSIVSWALHMELRNGDRNALSKPIALRGGATMAFEVVVIRRDGFDGPIDLRMENLPEGVTATGLTIPAGKSRGIMLFTAAPEAPRGLTSAKLLGVATINGESVTREGRVASMAWPVPNAWSEIPAPRLLADIPVSVSGGELAPITLAPAEDKIYEAVAGQTLTIPLAHSRRSEFSGPKISLKTFGAGFEGTPAFDVPLDADASEATFDLAKLKVAPGEYTIAFYGSAVAKYRYHPESVTIAEAVLKTAQDKATAAAAEVTKLTESVGTAAPEDKAALEASLEMAKKQQQAADAEVAAADKNLKTVTAKAAPKDIVDIVVSSPIHIRVQPAAETVQK